MIGNLNHMPSQYNNSSHSPISRVQSQESSDEVDAIIAKVMGQIARKSRRKEEDHQNRNHSLIASRKRFRQIQIVEVNRRLQLQNQGLKKDIQKLQTKLKKIEKRQTNTNVDSKKKQLEQLERRLDRASRNTSRIQTEILNVTKYQNKKSLGKNFLNKSYKGKILKTDPRSPKQELYDSPIMQFNDFDLNKNQNENSSIEKSPSKPSNNTCTKLIQVDLDYEETKQQEERLDALIEYYQQYVKNNNRKIGQLEGILLS